MKICCKCGAHNSDERFFCIDCNEKLGSSLSKAEEAKINEDINESLENMYNKRDPLYVSKFDKAAGLAAIAGLLCSIILFAVNIILKRSCDLLWMALLCLSLSVIEAFFPKITWALEKMRLSLFISDAEAAEPSELYTLCRRLTIVALAVI